MKCKFCNNGKVKMSVQTNRFYNEINHIDCNVCLGTGIKPEECWCKQIDTDGNHLGYFEKCNDCNGTGRVHN